MAESRKRRRHGIEPEKRQAIANRVCDFYTNENTNRSKGRELRLQRHAKYRGWRSGTDWPWPGAADTSIPDMVQDSLRVQDTLFNAVMSQRPPVISEAKNKADAEKQDTIDKLIDYQFFREANGKEVVGDAAEAFVNDPVCTIFTPWVKEKRTVSDITVFDKIPDDAATRDYLLGILRRHFPAAKRFDEKSGGWEWTLTKADDTEDEVSFYTNDEDEVELVERREAVIYDGIKPQVMDYDDVLYPARVANLQRPGPSNPNGSPWVVLRSFPIYSEIKDLAKSKYYDLPTADELEKMANTAGSTNLDTDAQQQKDVLAGTSENPGREKDKSHRKLTRLICFDIYDIDGDGYEEDCIFTVILETRTLLKARLLTDMYPSIPPRRPLDGKSFLPIQGRYDGISLLELLEPTHDATKVLVDQMLNSNDLSISSPGFYRPSGGMNPEVMRVEPYTIFPLQNPQQDITFPQIGNPQALGFALNMLGIFGGWQDKTGMVSDLQFGQIPSGSSSGLRTTGNMALAMGQGEARPERILHRFFEIWTGVWEQAHCLNTHFLPKEKQIRVAGAMPNQDPYMKIDGPAAIKGGYNFGFDANVLNTSKAALQQSLEKLLGTYVNQLTLQMGIVTPENFYRMLRDLGKAYGQNVDRYITPPTPEANQPRILAEEAILSIMNGVEPYGIPLETGGYAEHMQKLVEFVQSVNFGEIKDPAYVDLFGKYMKKVQAMLARDVKQQQTMQGADAFAQRQNQKGPGAPPQSVQMPRGQPPKISGPKEMMNEKLPTAGGGANGGGV